MKRAIVIGRPPLVAIAGLFVLAAIALRFEGHRWWCAAGDLSPWSGDINSQHNSQHLFDVYSFSHVLHGVLFFWGLEWARARISWGWRLTIATAIEAAWEVLENSPIIIDRYRQATIALGYNGDSVINSLCDILACVAGFALASRIGFWRSVAVFVVLEVACLIWIKDNLTLNVLMLAHPIEAVKAWQMGR